MVNRKITADVICISLLISSQFCFAQKTTIDPNIAAQKIENNAIVTDKRLDQKITYRANQKYVSDVMEDLSKLSGVKFIAGHGDWDWRVREDKINIIAKDAKLSSLISSISDVMKFRWVRSGESPNFTYRLVEDETLNRHVRQLAERRERANRNARRKYIEKLTRVGHMSKSELAKLREDEPIIYLYNEAGIAKPLSDFLNMMPEIKDAIINNDEDSECVIESSDMSPETKDALANAAYSLAKLRIQMRGQPISNLPNIEDYETAQIDVSFFPNIYYKEAGSVDIIARNAGKILTYGLPEFTPSMDCMDKLRGKMQLEAFENNKKIGDVYNEMKKDIAAARSEAKKERYYSATDDLHIENPNDPYLDTVFNKKVDSNNVADWIAAISDASKLTVVTDNIIYNNFETVITDNIINDNVKGDNIHKTKDILDSLTNEKYYNCALKDGNLELWKRDWYWWRGTRVSQAWLAQKRKIFKENGTLDLDDLADIASLTDEQLAFNICDDPVLCQCDRLINKRWQFLKLYNQLSSQQRTALLSENGLAFSDISSDLQNSIINTIHKMNYNLPDWLDLFRLKLRAVCTRELVGKHYVYTFQAVTGNGNILSGDYIVSTPEYVEPPKDANKETK